MAAVWLVVATALGAALVAARLDRSGLDDPDLAHQRPGFLDAAHSAFPAPDAIEGLPVPGRRLIVFFARPQQQDSLARSLARDTSLQRQADVVIVVSPSGPRSAAAADPIRIHSDPDGRIAAAYGMRTPRDGGPPVGYAIVDRSQKVRYQTLDPDVAHRLDEVTTMLRATP